MQFAEIYKAISPYLQFLTVFSLVLFLASIAVIPWLVGLLPADYFIRPVEQGSVFSRKLSISKIFVLLVRNGVGLFLLGAGIVMLFTPGQGILCILLGLVTMSFPQKHRLIRYLCKGKKVQDSLDWIRIKAGKPVFLWR